MSDSPHDPEPAVTSTDQRDDDVDGAGVVESPLETAVTNRLASLTDALLGTRKVVDHILPLVKNHLIAATDEIIPQAREQLSEADAIAYFTARIQVLLSPPPPLTNWLLIHESKRILEEDPEALSIWPKPSSPLRKCVRDVLSDGGMSRPTCMRVLSDSALLSALEEGDATGEDYVAKQIADHILKNNKAPRKAARLYAQRYADQMGRNRFLRGLSLVLRGYWVWTFIRSAVPIVVDLGVLFGTISAGLPVMLATQASFRRITSAVNFSFKHFCALTAL